MTQEQDIVLIYYEDKPFLFARIEDISPDVKKGWYTVKMLILQMPLQVVTWILKESYIDGEEFTMNGHKMRMKKVVCPQDPEEESDLDPDLSSSRPAKVISFNDLKKRG